MRDRNLTALVAIILLALVALYIALPIPHPDWLKNALFWQPKDLRSLELKLGLDLQGGLEVLLEADLPPDQEISKDAIDAARVIVEQRVNGLGVTEPLVQLQGDRRIIVQLPGIQKPEQAIATIKGTGLLEFVDAGAKPLPRGATIRTDFASSEPSAEEGAVTATGEITTTGTVTATGEITATETTTATAPFSDQIYHTVMTGADLQDARVQLDNLGRPYIAFELTDTGAKKFEEYTAQNIGRFLCITMDKVVISCPEIRAKIGKRGIIEGGQQGFELAEARNLAIQMRYGALPVPLKVVDVRTVGPTLGQDSIQKSITAGLVGVSVVLLFMLIYYRLPGLLADFALLTYAVLNLAIYKLVPITLTLPGIAGFLLSTGMAVDANILIFERMKEELRAGRPLHMAVEAGFSRAWTSIWDSNLSTIITCIILAWFGSNFGASTVKGFAVNLGLGVLISMFTAVVATRTFMRATLSRGGEEIRKRHWLLGI
ncbi:MAG: protein translocase subunit SecD [Chloroflexi bacterium]|nr:protein translocase subunit SecD [Chloroflexota bacterium]